MTFPATAITSSISILANMFQNQNEHEREMYRIQVTEQIASMQFALREMELTTERERIQAQLTLGRERIQAEKEILQSLIATSQHAFDRKLDFFRESYRQSFQLLQAHQELLKQELTTLTDRRFDKLSDTDSMRLENRITEINVSLLDLNKILHIMNIEFNDRVERLTLNAPNPHTRYLR
jgi:hypothetical protein